MGAGFLLHDALPDTLLFLAGFHDQILLRPHAAALSFGAAAIIAATSVAEQTVERATRQAKILADIRVNGFGYLLRLDRRPADLVATVVGASASNNDRGVRGETDSGNRQGKRGHGESKGV